MPIKDPEARKAYQKEYAQRNKSKAYARVKKWREANPEKWAEQSKKYAQKYPEKCIAKTKAWIANNPIKAAESSRKSRIKHAGRVQANKAKYRASKKNRTPIWTSATNLFEMQCIYTYRTALQAIGLNYEVDHIIPLQGKMVSGLHTPENLQVITTEQNRLKNNRYGF